MTTPNIRIYKSQSVFTVIISFDACMLSRVQLFAISRTVAHQALLSMGFPRQEYWSGLPFLSRGVLPDPGMELVSPAPLALAGGFFTTVPPGSLVISSGSLVTP